MPGDSGKLHGVACGRNTFCTFCIWCFDIWGLADPGGTAPFMVGQFLEIEYDSPSSAPFTGKAANLEPAPQPSPLWVSHTLGYYPLALLTQVPEN